MAQKKKTIGRLKRPRQQTTTLRLSMDSYAQITARAIEKGVDRNKIIDAWAARDKEVSIL
jgi:hypothetical protein